MALVDSHRPPLCAASSMPRTTSDQNGLAMLSTIIPIVWFCCLAKLRASLRQLHVHRLERLVPEPHRRHKAAGAVAARRQPRGLVQGRLRRPCRSTSTVVCRRRWRQQLPRSLLPHAPPARRFAVARLIRLYMDGINPNDALLRVYQGVEERPLPGKALPPVDGFRREVRFLVGPCKGESRAPCGTRDSPIREVRRR